LSTSILNWEEANPTDAADRKKRGVVALVLVLDLRSLFNGMAEKIKVGIVGAGRMAVEHISVLKEVSGVEIVGITSRTRQKAGDLAARFGIPHVTDDLNVLMAEAKPEGLLVLVSPEQMYSVSLEALECGVPVFIEKPPGMLPGEAWRLAETARVNNISTLVGFNRRFYSVFQKGCEIIKEHGPLLGLLVEGHERILDIRKRRLRPEGMLSTWLYANAIHTIDLLRFFGGEIEEMHALAHRRQEAMGDQFSAVMNFDSGALGTYVAHWLSPGGWRVVLYGQGVTVEFKPLESGVWTDSSFKQHEILADACDEQFKPGFYRQMVAFKELVLGGELVGPAQDLAGAYQTMHLAEKLCAKVDDRYGDGNRV
jgi:predicted dehydrogenase